MRYLFVLFVPAILLSSCFTSNLLKKETNVSAIPSDSYSFNRAYYDTDSLLHIDFTNNTPTRKKMNYYGITIDINAILKEYSNSTVDPVYFRRRFVRKYNAISATSINRNCTCSKIFDYNNGTLINFRDIKVDYFKTLPPVADSIMLYGVDQVPANCCWIIDDINDDGLDVVPVNKPTTIFIIPVSDSLGSFVALRFPLKDRSTKMGVLPLYLLADIVTSPIQLIGLIIENKLNGDNDNSNNNSGGTTYHQTPKPKDKDKDKDKKKHEDRDRRRNP